MGRSVDPKGGDFQYIPVLPSDMPSVPLMNDTKWAELREAMLEIEPRPQWISVDATSGYRYGPDGEWYHHFRLSPYSSMLSVDILTPDAVQREQVRAALKKIHLPGEETSEGFRVLGYAAEGQAVSYI